MRVGTKPDSPNRHLHPGAWTCRWDTVPEKRSCLKVMWKQRKWLNGLLESPPHTHTHPPPHKEMCFLIVIALALPSSLWHVVMAMEDYFVCQVFPSLSASPRCLHPHPWPPMRTVKTERTQAQESPGGDAIKSCTEANKYLNSYCCSHRLHAHKLALQTTTTHCP